MSARLLYISDSLGLPRDAQTSTLVIFGGRGMGKTNLIAVAGGMLRTVQVLANAASWCFWMIHSMV